MVKELRPGLCSVVCLTYNHAVYSAQAIQSIYDQTYRDIEIVIIDDGSRDENVATIRRKLQESPFPFSLIDQENTGKIGLNMNRALEAANGEFLCMLSLDDLLLPDCIERKVHQLRLDPHLMLVFDTCHKEIDSSGAVISEYQTTPLYGRKHATAAEMLELEYETIGTFYLQGAVLRRSLVDEIGGYDIDLTGDDLILRTKIWQYMLERPELTIVLQHIPGFVYRKSDQSLHRQTFRQLRTVVEWRDRYFTSRPLPDLFVGWANHFFRQCTDQGNDSELKVALDYSPEIKSMYRAYCGSWKFRRRAIKRFIKSKLGLNRIRLKR